MRYYGKVSNHTPGALRVIPSGVLNYLAEITLQKLIFNSERVDNVYPDHVNALREASLAPSNSPTMGELWKGKYDKMDLDNKKLP